jgi:hypothetical protein
MVVAVPSTVGLARKVFNLQHERRLAIAEVPHGTPAPADCCSAGGD